jgi:hypothetical protein
MTLPDLIRAIAELDPCEAPAILSAGYALMAKGSGKPAAETDELVDIDEAVRLLSVSESYLYHAKKLPFAVKVGKRRMFSRLGIQRHIAKQQGKA